MTYTPDELFHLERVRGRLVTADVKAAFARLMNWAEASPLQIYPVSRGAFSAIHLSTKVGARRYADCEYGFKGAARHMRFWFRQPGFESGLFGGDEIDATFVGTITKKGERTTDLFSVSDVDRLISFLEVKHP